MAFYWVGGPAMSAATAMDPEVERAARRLIAAGDEVNARGLGDFAAITAAFPGMFGAAVAMRDNGENVAELGGKIGLAYRAIETLAGALLAGLADDPAALQYVAQTMRRLRDLRVAAERGPIQ